MVVDAAAVEGCYSVMHGGGSLEVGQKATLFDCYAGSWVAARGAVEKLFRILDSSGMREAITIITTIVAGWLWYLKK